MSIYVKSWKPMKKFLYRAIYKNQKTIAVSNGIKEDFIGILMANPKVILTIYNPFDIKKINELSKEFIQFSNFVLYIGSINKIKRLDVLVKAYKESKISQDLVLLGFSDDKTEYEKEIISLINQLGLGNKIKCMSFTRNPYKYIKKADLVILSSDHEGLPSVLIEALILKTKIVSTSCSAGISEIFTGSLKNYISTPGNYHKLSQNIVKALEKELEISKKYYHKFDSENIFENYLELIND
jgi:glycosyltransferase involved in cell wall biosynthesis